MNEELHNLIDAYLAGEISEAGAEALSNLLRDEQARTLFLQAADLHANLTVDESLWTQPADVVEPIPLKKSRFSWKIGALAAGLVALLSLLFLHLQQLNTSDTSFATLANTRSAFWEDCDLPTAVGSRLGIGKLRLASGMATLHFDSGAEVIVEAPATLILVDAMNCKLLLGTFLSDIPDSALGFRIKTPSADVVDYGTRFAVSVFEDTGETLTKVMKGKVQVEYADSDKIVELTTGQRSLIQGEAGSERTHEEYRTIPVPAIDFGPKWQLLRTVKDAYTGRIASHESETLLYLKRSINSGGSTRISWLGFDLKNIGGEQIEEAVMLLHFAPTGFGLASFVPDAEFGVYGLVGKVPEWDESILHRRFPGDPQLTYLGSFHVPQGVQSGQFRVRTERLNNFLRKHASSKITLKVVRETTETEGGGLVHGFASHRHPFLPAPTLAIHLK